MIIPDVNVLLYAVTDAFPQHEVARRWWEQTLSGREDVGLVPCVTFGFVRLMTSAKVLVTPMSMDAASGLVGEWLARPQVNVLLSDERHLRKAMELLKVVGTAGNLTTDAQIAAHALLEDAVVATNDADFARLPGVRTVNPVGSLP